MRSSGFQAMERYPIAIQAISVIIRYPDIQRNKLIIANGPLAGTGISSCGRLSIGEKSPLTGDIKESNAGGTTANHLAQWGIRGIVLEGVANATHILVIGDKVKLVKIPELFELTTSELSSLQEKYGSRASIICIGPAGDNKLSAAGIAVTDKGGMPCRYAGRGGLGAVMGSKRLKAVVILEPSANRIIISNRSLFREKAKELHKRIRNNPVTGKSFPEYGTLFALNLVQELGGLPTRNFREGRFEGAVNISSEALRDLIIKRGGKGKTAHSCMRGCVVQCSNIVPDEKGEVLVSPLEYETVGLMGSNLGIDSIDNISRFNKECNEV